VRHDCRAGAWPGKIDMLLRLWWLLGLGTALTAAGMLSWGVTFARVPADGGWLLLGSALAYSASLYVAERMARVDRIGAGSRTALVSTLFIYGLLALLLLFARVYYSRLFLVSMLLLTLGTLLLTRQLRRRFLRPVYAYMPDQLAPAVVARVPAVWLPLHEPQLPRQPVSAVIADYASADPDWQRLMSTFAGNQVPLLSGTALEESVSGRVRLDLLTRRNVGEFQPHVLYAPFKRLLDLLLVLLVLPPALLLMTLIALLVRLESHGPALFIQQRVGLGGRPFMMLKFRTMRVDRGGGGRFTELNDPRITRLGRWLRITRLDELPQLWNVLRGEMSLIGPRPEQAALVQEFMQSIPYYGYRHMLRPGITGWAQVTQGYVAGTNGTRRKLEYDLYYVRHCSLWLDLVITIRTLRILATGFGAR
jgi:UDP-GalNAc:undecaprenyl-phosphate GalNAc-1-phosphate transferase